MRGAFDACSPSRVSLAAVALLVAWSSACSSEVSPAAGDAASDAGASVDAATPVVITEPRIPSRAVLPVTPALPAPPHEVSFAPCPLGWTSSTSTRTYGETVCLPYAGASSILDCPPGQVHLPGAASCEPTGATCRTGQWPDLIPAGAPRVVYVAPGAAPAGDGSQLSPYATISAAISSAASTPDSAIVLARGIYTEDVAVTTPLHLYGACAAGSRIAGTLRITATRATVHDLAAEDVVIASAAEVTLSGTDISGGTGITVTGASNATIGATVVARSIDSALRVEDHSTVTLTGSALLAATRRGLEIDATSSAHLARVLIDRTRPDPATGEFGWAIALEGTLTASTTVLSRSTELGLWTDGANAAATLDLVVIQDTESSALDGDYGRAIEAASGAHVTASRLLIERAHEVALYASDAGTDVSLHGAVLRDIRPRASDGALGRGLHADEGAALALEGAVIDGASDHGAISIDAPTTLTAADLVVRNIAATSVNPARGIGLTAQDGAAIELHRAYFEQTAAAGITVTFGSRAELEDLTLYRVRGTRTGRLGAGIVASRGSQLTLRRGLVQDTHLAGILATEQNTSLTLEDLTVRAVEHQNSDATFGRGLDIESGAELTLTRAYIEACRELGLFISAAPSRAHLFDVTVARMNTSARDNLTSRAVLAQLGASVDGARVLLDQNKSVAFAVSGTSAVALEDLTVRATDSDPAGQFGIGLAALESGGSGPDVSLLRAVFEDNRHIALFADGPMSRIAAVDLTVSGTRPQTSRDAFGVGVYAAGGSTIVLEGAWFERNHFAALAATGAGSILDVTDTTVRDTDVDGNGIYGNGVGVEKSAHARLTRVRVEHNQQFGVLAQSGAEIEMSEVSVVGTRRLECSDGACESIAGGVGIGVWGAHVSGERFLISGNEVAGAAIAESGELDLSYGEISSQPIGVNIETMGFDISRISREVIFRDNQRSVDASMLPVPDPFAELPELGR